MKAINVMKKRNVVNNMVKNVKKMTDIFYLDVPKSLWWKGDVTVTCIPLSVLDERAGKFTDPAGIAIEHARENPKWDGPESDECQYLTVREEILCSFPSLNKGVN